MVEPASFDDVMPFGDAVALLHAVRAGTADDDLIPVVPLLAVEIDGSATSGSNPGQPLRPTVPWPCVVAGVNRSARSAPTPQPPAGADLYLTDAVDPPRPWVSTRAPEQLTAAIGANPQASATLVQVLRAHRGNVEHDLLMESLAYAALQAGNEHRSWLEANDPGRSRDVSDSPAVSVTRSGRTLDLVLDRPSRRNAYSARMRDDLVAALQLALSDATITEVNLRGHGHNFCSGGDLAEFGTVENPSTAHQIRMTRSAAYLAHVASGRLTVHVHGSCVGAGVELAAFAGRVSADPGTTFRLPEVGMGLIPGAGGTASIPRRIGRERTAWLALTGTEIDADTAFRWGLVDSIAPVLPMAPL